MRNRATAQDVAIAAGVSKWTVIRAFTPGASIAEASRAKVLSAARALSYSPNLLARSLATNVTHQVAILVDDFTNPHKLPFLERLTATLQSEGLVGILININAQLDHVHALITADQRHVDAVVLCGTSFHDEALIDRRLGPGMPPMYVLARDSQIDGVPAINCDTELAMREICEHLAAAARRNRRPAFMSCPSGHSTALGRRKGFSDFWSQRLGAEVLDLTADRYSATSGAEAMRRYLDSTPADQRIDLIMCENDVLACGASDVIKYDYGLRIPGDIAVVGFDNIELTATPNYRLTSYDQPKDEMARAVVDMILGRRERQSLNLPGRLVVRESA